MTFNNNVFHECTLDMRLAIIISYPTSMSGIIIVLLKTSANYQKFIQTLFVKTANFQLVFNFRQTRTVTCTIFGEHGIMAHIPWRLSQSVFHNNHYYIATNNKHNNNNNNITALAIKFHRASNNRLLNCISCETTQKTGYTCTTKP